MAGGMAMMLLCTLLFSCNNEDFLESGNPEKACDNICFGISSDKDVQTRGYAGSDDEGYTADRFVLRSDDSADTLCVRAIVSDGINVSGFEGEQALTRATPVGKDNFYDKFHVLAYWKKNSTLVDNQFYMDTNASNSAASVGTGAIWSTEQIYYWPGAGHSFQFYAWAPTDADGLVTPTTPETKTLAYTVPEAAADQKDIVVATTNEIQGDNNAAVPLSFKHICTAVRFAVGSQMQPGFIKSVALEGVKKAGTYDMATGTWALAETTTDFSQDDLNKSMTGNETAGAEITSSEGTFMMLPQTLPAGATIKVVFTNASGVDRTLTASIRNTVWTMGTTVTYKLSITPEYEMNIEVPTEAQDAHYITFPITVNVKDYDGAWTLTSNLTNDVFFTQTKTELQEQGYWIDDDKGTNTISGTGSGSFTYHVYVTENIGDAARDLQFQITPDDVNGATPTTATISQLCPSWNGNIGCERIEDGAYPWGFLWDSNMTIKYTVPSVASDFIGHYISSLLIDLSNVGQYNYVTIDRPFLSIRSITIDFSKLTANGVAENLDNGLQNTNDIYNYNGANEASDLIARLERYGCTPDKELPTNPSDFAAKSCFLKNKFTKKTESQKGVSVDIPVLINLEWYLPAKTEAPNMEDETYPLNGIYWTSTALQGSSEQSYIYSNGNSESTDKRDVIHNVRAVRQKP